MPYLQDLDPQARLEKVRSLLTDANDVYNSSNIDPEEWKKFYLGSNQWDGIKAEGDVKLTIPLTSVMLDQHVFLFTNRPPSINVKPPSPSPLDRVKAQVGEDQIRNLLYDSRFPLMFQEATMTMAQMGDVYPYLYWDSNDKKRSSAGTAKMTYLSPSTTRIIHGNGFRFHPTGVIFWERLDSYQVMDKYGYDGEVDYDANYDWVKTLNIALPERDKVTVFTYVDDNVYMVFTGREELVFKEHNMGFVPVELIRQSIVPDSINGLPLLYNADGIQQQLNLLFSAAVELGLDLAYLPLLEYNNALGNQKVKKWRRQKIKVRRSDKGESLQYLTNPNNPAVLLEQIRSLIDLSYVVMQMPPAALGISESQISSGFQARVYQQPATTKQMSWGVQWEAALQNMSGKFFKMLQKMAPGATRLELPNGDMVDLKGIEDYDILVQFQESTPIDEVRNTQMMILRLQNNLVSVYQALEELGDENPFDTIEIMKQEAQDVVLNPERVTKVAQAQALVKQLISQTMQSAQQMGGQVQMSPERQAQLPEELQQMANFQNPVNSARGLGQALPEEQGEYAPGGAERVQAESLGGGLPPEVLPS